MDPFAWVSDHCHVSSSQEEMLNAAPYLNPNLAPVSESEDEEEETVVVMMSVPDSSSEDEFRTPPERHSHSLTSSNEARVMEVCEDVEVNCGGRRQEDKEEKIVDLSRDSDVSGYADKDLLMEDGRVPLTDWCEARRDVEPTVEVNNGSLANPEVIRTFDDAGTDCCRDEGVAKVDEFMLSSKGVAEEVKRVTYTSTLDNRSLNVRKLPSSICTSGKGVGKTRDDELGMCSARTDKGDGRVEASREMGHSSAETDKGIAGADDGSGKKSSEAKEPNEDEQTENILKVLGLLAKPLRPVYMEKVDIIGSAIKSGIKFPRPSWWPEDSDDESI